MINIDNLVTEYYAFIAEMQAKLSTSMKEIFKEFFEENPDIKIITWAQYTPYFNDGDECIFGVNEMEFSTSDERPNSVYDLEEYKHSYYDDESNFVKNFGKVKVAELRSNFNILTSQLVKIPDDVYKTTFGDHVRIWATRDGFDVEEYDHD